MALIADVFPKLWTPKKVVIETSKKICFRGHFDKQLGNGSKHCCNPKQSEANTVAISFTMFIDHWEDNWVEKNLS